MTLFIIINDLLTKKSGGTLCDQPGFDAVFNKYMIIRYMSMVPKFSAIVEICNLLQPSLTNRQMYVVLYKAIPKQGSGYISYLKPEKEKPTDE